MVRVSVGGASSSAAAGESVGTAAAVGVGGAVETAAVAVGRTRVRAREMVRVSVGGASSSATVAEAATSAASVVAATPSTDGGAVAAVPLTLPSSSVARVLRNAFSTCRRSASMIEFWRAMAAPSSVLNLPRMVLHMARGMQRGHAKAVSRSMRWH